MKVIGKVGNTLIIILLIVFALIALLSLLTRFNVGPLRIYFVDSEFGSMGTTIKNGDLAIFKTINPDEVQTGDIIYFERLGSPTVHRVTAIVGDCVSTKGDNVNIDADPGCAYNISAKYLFRIPLLGYLFLGLRFMGVSIVTGFKVITGML